MMKATDVSSPAPVRILLVSPLPPPMGGMETWTQILCERGLPPPFDFELVDTRALQGHPQAPMRLNLRGIRRNLGILWKMQSALARGGIALMHLNCFLTFTGMLRNLASVLLARKSGVPCIVHLHGTFTVPLGNGPAARAYRWICRALFQRAAWILLLGRPSHDAVQALGNFKAKIEPLMPNFVDFTAIPAAPAARARKYLRVMFSGALVEAKGVDTLVEIARRLPWVRLQLVGDGPPEARARLLRHIREAGVENRVRVSGPATNREVLNMLSRNDVFLFPSRLMEGFPISVAEAMAVGLPIVASAVGALPEMVDVPAGGFLYAPNAIDSYVEALERLHAEPALRQSMGRHNREKARREYDYDVVVQRLVKIYAATAIRA